MNCPYCNSPLPPNAPVCTNCGAAQTIVEDPGKSKGTTAMILGFVGLGLNLLGFGGVPGLVCSIIAWILSKQATELSATIGLENQNAHTAKICALIGMIWNSLIILSVVAILAIYLIFIFFTVFLSTLAYV